MKKQMVRLALLTCMVSFSTASYAEVVASVNGVDITTEQLLKLKTESKKRLGQELADKDLIDTLIRTEVVKQAAVASGFNENPQVLSQLKELKLQIILSEYMKDLASKITFTDEEFKKTYKEFVEKFPKNSYKASHILLKEESEAKEIIKQLAEKDADFSALAKEKSTGPSGANGGSLGWFEAASMVKPFAEALSQMKKGEYSKTPVKTKFGYHVILLEDTKANKIPTLEQLRPEFEKEMMPVKLLKAVEELTAKAKVVRNTK